MAYQPRAFTDFTLHFNVMNKQLQVPGKIPDRMFFDIKTLEKKLEVLESGQLKYFPNPKLPIENTATYVDNPGSRHKMQGVFLHDSSCRTSLRQQMFTVP